MLCTASEYNIVLISYDRYQSVSNAVLYRVQHVGTGKIVAQMLGVWVLSFLTNGPVILILESWEQNDTDMCEPAFLRTPSIAVVLSLLEFLVPIFLVAYFNAYIYWSLWKRGNLSECLSHPAVPSVSSSDDPGRSCRQGPGSREETLPTQKQAAASLGPDKPRQKSSLFFSIAAHKNSSVIASKAGSLSHSDSLALQQREHLEHCRARKLAKSLAILLGVFAICWAPYSLATIIHSIFYEQGFDKSKWYKMAFWLQWLNSFVNPFLYPLCHKRFQRAFLKIFRVRRQSVPVHNRSVSS